MTSPAGAAATDVGLAAFTRTPLTTTIASVVDAQTVTLTTPATLSVSSTVAYVGPSDNAIIDAAIASLPEGGGTLYFPPGPYHTGSQHLRSHVTLWLENGAPLLGSKTKEAA